MKWFVIALPAMLEIIWGASWYFVTRRMRAEYSSDDPSVSLATGPLWVRIHNLAWFFYHVPILVPLTYIRRDNAAPPILLAILTIAAYSFIIVICIL